jgi:hypothetical protein
MRKPIQNSKENVDTYKRNSYQGTEKSRGGFIYKSGLIDGNASEWWWW